MTINKTICLSENVFEELAKERNASKLINSLLQDYFSVGGGLEKSALLQKISNQENEILAFTENLALLKEKLKSIQKHDALIKDIFKEIPDEILDDFKQFPLMSEKILFSRFSDIYSKRYKIKYEELLKAFNEYFKERNAKLEQKKEVLNETKL